MDLVDALRDLAVSLRVLSANGLHFVVAQHTELAFDFVLVPCFERQATEDGELGLSEARDDAALEALSFQG